MNCPGFKIMLHSWVSWWVSKCVIGFDGCGWVFGRFVIWFGWWGFWFVGVMVGYFVVMVVLDDYFFFGFGGLEFRGIVIVGCCYYGWRRLWLWFCDGFCGYGSGCYGWLWLWWWWLCLLFLVLDILFYYIVYIILMC